MEDGPLVCGCGQVFTSVFSLTIHVSDQQFCLQFWGGNIQNLKEKVKKLRNAWNYQRNKEKLAEKRRIDYNTNPGPMKETKRLKYKTNPGPMKETKRLKYKTNPEPKKEKYKEFRAKKDEDSEVALHEFKKAGR